MTIEGHDTRRLTKEDVESGKYEPYEAVKAWITQSRFDTFTAGVALGNKPSVALLKKLGFQLVKTEKMAFRKDENGQDIICDCGIFEYKK